MSLKPRMQNEEKKWEGKGKRNFKVSVCLGPISMSVSFLAEVTAMLDSGDSQLLQSSHGSNARLLQVRIELDIHPPTQNTRSRI